jgi:hypothetical protein
MRNLRDSLRRQSDALPSRMDRGLLIQHCIQLRTTAHTKLMKLKVVFTLLFLAGSAFAQLIPIREESGFMSSYGEISPLTFTLTYDGPAIAYETRGHIPSSLSLRDSFPATLVLAETPGFGASSQGVGLHRFAADSVPTAAETSAPTTLDLAFSTADSRAQSDSFPINQDQGVLALIAASTLP